MDIRNDGTSIRQFEASAFLAQTIEQAVTDPDSITARAQRYIDDAHAGRLGIGTEESKAEGQNGGDGVEANSLFL